MQKYYITIARRRPQGKSSMTGVKVIFDKEVEGWQHEDAIEDALTHCRARGLLKEGDMIATLTCQPRGKTA